jgi:hypothetical protein
VSKKLIACHTLADVKPYMPDNTRDRSRNLKIENTRCQKKDKQPPAPAHGGWKIKKTKRGVDLLVCVCVFNAIVYTICQHKSNCLPYQLGVSKTNNLAAKFFED